MCTLAETPTKVWKVISLTKVNVPFKFTTSSSKRSNTFSAWVCVSVPVFDECVWVCLCLMVLYFLWKYHLDVMETLKKIIQKRHGIYFFLAWQASEPFALSACLSSLCITDFIFCTYDVTIQMSWFQWQVY